MDLLLKAVIIAVVAIIVVGGIITLVYRSHTTTLNESGAEALAIKDTTAHYPGAQVNITGITPSNAENKSWNITLSVIYNATKPCPNILIGYFDYPITGLLFSSENVWSYGNSTKCTISSYQQNAAYSYVVSLPAMAIARSFISNDSRIKTFISIYGYNNVAVTAGRVSPPNYISTPLGANMTNVWVIKYTAPSAKYSTYALVNQSSGGMIGSYNSN